MADPGLALEGGVVHEQVDATELARGRVDHARALRFFGEISGDERHAHNLLMASRGRIRACDEIVAGGAAIDETVGAFERFPE